MPKFRKKPVVIEAIQLTQELFWETYRNGWHSSLPVPFQNFSFSGSYHPGNKTIGYVWIGIPTLEGNMEAEIGDWIIKGVKGEFYPCKPDIFEKTYEPVEAPKEKQNG